MECGIDEAGRGPLLGPMVMAGVLATPEQAKEFKKLEITDSKKVSPKRRDELFIKIKEIATDYVIKIVSAKKIDEALLSPSMNLNRLEAKTTAIIINKLDPKISYVDCPSINTTAYKEYLAAHVKVSSKLVVEHKADENYITSSAASILAKVTRDREIEKIKKKFGDCGSGYPSDPVTKEFLKNNYENPDIDFFRKTWAPYKNIKNAKNQTSLDNY